MKDKKLVLTIAIGETYQKMKVHTHPSIRSYAKRIGAEFLSIEKPKISSTTPHWEKFQIYELLNEYDRILYIDTDIIIREDCPDLFEIVPSNQLGMFNEAPFTDRSKELMIDICKSYDTKLEEWNGQYYNSGVMVISRTHKQIFKKPEKEIFNFFEQSYLNMVIAMKQTNVFSLEYKFNRMTCLDPIIGEDRFASYIIHYAGYPSVDFVLAQIPKDMARWQEDKKSGYIYKRHIYIAVTGGLGDQINAEPAIRYMRKHIYPEDDINVITHWPRLFAHLDVQAWEHGKFEPMEDTPYCIMNTLPGPETIMWSIVSNLLCHTVDYCSMALLKRILPQKDKRPILVTDPKDVINIRKIIGGPIKDLILVHAGRHWESKTIPQEWWQEVVDSLQEKGFTVCLIGKNEENRGVHDLDVRERMIDVRDRLELGELIALISEAPLLISNDSAPIHIAGAFDNSILVIPTCKHPEHILPWRYDSVWWNARALYKKLTIDDVCQAPTEVHGSSGEFIKKNWKEYLPMIDEVILNVKEMTEDTNG